jgi:hypothetical protein
MGFKSKLTMLDKVCSLALILSFLSGCGKNMEVIANPFGDPIFPLNTHLDRQLRSLNQSHVCLDAENTMLSKKNTHEITVKIVQKKMDELFLNMFGVLPDAGHVKRSLEVYGGAYCKNFHDAKNIDNTISCIIVKEYVYGLKRLYITGWSIGFARWQKDIFEYRLEVANGRIMKAQGTVVGGECYVIDEFLYGKSKTIKPIRRFQ